MWHEQIKMNVLKSLLKPHQTVIGLSKSVNIYFNKQGLKSSDETLCSITENDNFNEKKLESHCFLEVISFFKIFVADI